MICFMERNALSRGAHLSMRWNRTHHSPSLEEPGSRLCPFSWEQPHLTGGFDNGSLLQPESGKLLDPISIPLLL